jgi:hypothetical protein
MPLDHTTGIQRGLSLGVCSTGLKDRSRFQEGCDPARWPLRCYAAHISTWCLTMTSEAFI